MVHIPPQARAILDSWPRRPGDFIFPAERSLGAKRDPRVGHSGRGAISGFPTAVMLTQKRSGTSGWTAHDLRRTMATRLSLAGVPPHVIEAALNHAAPGLIRTYQVAGQQRAVAEAVDAWGAALCSLAGLAAA